MKEDKAINDLIEAEQQKIEKEERNNRKAEEAPIDSAKESKFLKDFCNKKVR